MKPMLLFSLLNSEEERSVSTLSNFGEYRLVANASFYIRSKYIFIIFIFIFSHKDKFLLFFHFFLN